MNLSSPDRPSDAIESVESLSAEDPTRDDSPPADGEMDGRDAPNLPGPSASSQMIYHGFYLGLSLVVMVLAFSMRSEGPTQVFLPGMSVALPDLCMSKSLLKVPCPGCGMTRGFISIAHGQWQRAWAFNPTSYLVFVFIAAQVPWRLWQIMRIGSGKREVSPKIFTIPLMGMCALLIAQWAIRFFV